MESITTGANSSCGGGKTKYFEYHDYGQVERTWGETVYPVEYVYDTYGQGTEINTWRDPNDSYTWTGSSWPNPSVNEEVTKWICEAATGLLEKKVYDDHTESDPSIKYTYTVDGKIKTREWKRLYDSVRLKTTYTYSTGSTGTGEMTKIEYTDSTPQVEFAYDRLGRRKTVKEAGSTVVTFKYDDNGASSDLYLKSETITRDDYTKVITPEYEDGGPSTELPGRSAGFHIGTSTPYEYDVDYDYDAYGRLDEVDGPGLAAGGVVYGYETDSDLVEKHEFKDASSALVTVTRQYETDRDLIDWIKNEVNTDPVTLVSKYDYGLDTLGRRTSVVHTGARPASEPRSAHAIRPSVTTTSRRGLGMALNKTVEQPSIPAQSGFWK